MEYVATGGMSPAASDVVWQDPPLVVPVANSPVTSSPRSVAMPMHRSEPCTPPAPEAPEEVKHVSPPTITPDIDEEPDGAPLHFGSMVDLLVAVPWQGMGTTQHTEEVLAAIGDEPTTVEETLKIKPRHTTMVEELESIKENEMWYLVDLPKGHKEIGLKWVFKLKQDEQGCVVEHKARLVAKVYVQRHGVDFEEVFIPIAQMESMRVMFAVAAHYGWTVHHMDMKCTFLNRDVAEEVYVQQPPGFTIDGQERKVL
jgi:hypothetical protein